MSSDAEVESMVATMTALREASTSEVFSVAFMKVMKAYGEPVALLNLSRTRSSPAAQKAHELANKLMDEIISEDPK